MPNSKSKNKGPKIATVRKSMKVGKKIKLNIGKNGATSITTKVGPITFNKNLKTGEIKRYMTMDGITIEL